MSIFDRAFGQIEKGREGNNKGIPIPFDRLRSFLPNIQQKTYYLIGAQTKVGKTSLADDLFLYGAYDYVKNNPECGIQLDIDYFSYEIDSQSKIIKGIGRKLWHDYGIIAPANDILSRGENWCSDEVFHLVRDYRDYFNEMEDWVTVHEMPDNPTGMNKYLYNKAREHGETTLKNIQTDPDKPAINRFESYKPHNDNRYWIQMIDHIALLKEERGFNTKQNIDKMSAYLVQLRNNFNAIPVVIQQLAFDGQSDERYKQQRLTPTIRDFGDSKYTTRDANVILALFSPVSHGLDNFQGYDVGRLGNTYRNLEILANRDGEPNINVGLNFIGPVGTFRELPSADKITTGMYDYASSMTNGKSTYIDGGHEWIPR
jgi:hypothetical protein|tara:strand:+ start:5023 stop:6138 length:1116 start_codon:yes stop_codon:yes gene_type:complete